MMINLQTRVAAYAFVGMCAGGLSRVGLVAQEPAKQATAAKDARSRAASAATAARDAARDAAQAARDAAASTTQAESQRASEDGGRCRAADAGARPACSGPGEERFTASD